MKWFVSPQGMVSVIMVKPSLVKDRRRHLRVPCDRAVKVRCGVTGKYVAGRTVDLSDGGCLLELEERVAMTAGQAVTVGITHRPLQALILTDDMVAGTVVRRLGHAGLQHVAISFENARVLAIAS